MAVHRVAVRRAKWSRSVLAAAAGLAVVASVAIASPAQADDGGVSDAPILGHWEVQSLNGVDNNPYSPTLGSAGTKYLRIGPARYADGKSQMVSGPDPRYVSNRIFNDTNANVFSERGVSQWGNVWGQFIDHNVGHRVENGTASNLPFTATDPLESFTDTLGVIPFNRSAAAAGHRRHQRAAARQHRVRVHRRRGHLRQHRHPARLAARRHRRRQPGQQRGHDDAAGRLPAARGRPWQRRDLTDHGRGRPPAGHPDQGGRGRRRPRQRAGGADGDPDALRARAQPDRGYAAGEHVGGEQVPDRSRGRDRGDPVHHLHRVPAGDGRDAAVLPGLRPGPRPVDVARVRDRRLPGAQLHPR